MSKSLNQEVYNSDSSPFNSQVFDLFCSIGGLTYGLKQGWNRSQRRSGY